MPKSRVALDGWTAMSDGEFRKALESASELNITFVGRKTGKKFSTPVWFVNDGDKVCLLPVRGSKSNWYRNLLKNPNMELRVSNKKTTASARLTSDRTRVEEIVGKFRAKYGAGDVKRYYPGQDAAVELSIS